MNTDIVYKFVGEPGSFVVGAPARDIAEWEAKADPDMAAIVEANIANGGGLYVKVTKATAKAGKAADPVAE